MKKKFTVFIILFSVLLPFHRAKAQELAINSSQSRDLMDLSLEDLMNIAVVTASKSEEKIKDAPAVMNVITAREIEAYGAQTLFEILDRATSVYMQGNVLYHKNSVSMRGSVTAGPSRNVLILLDGRPMRESYMGGINQSILNGFPLSRIERIEIIRGPGSVLYGSNAFSGVINIITKKPENQGLLNGYATYGSFNTLQGGLSSGRKIGRFEIAGAVNYRNSQGYDFMTRTPRHVIRNKANTEDSLLLAPSLLKGSENTFGADLGVRYGDLKLAVNYSNSEQYRMGLQLDQISKTARLFTDLNYQKKISDFWTTSVSLTHNHQSSQTGQEELINSWDDNNSHDLIAEWTNFFKPFDNFNIVVGGLTNYQTGRGFDYRFQSDDSEYGSVLYLGEDLNPNPLAHMPEYEQTTWSTYLQTDYRPVSFLKLIAGIQSNKIPGFKLSVVPRIGTVLNFNESFGSKILYGHAFRAPAANERWVKVAPTILGNPNLMPEKVETFETQIFYTKPKGELSVTYFNNFQTDLIFLGDRSKGIIVNGVPVPRYENMGNQRFYGLELEGKSHLSRTLSLQGSATYQTSKDEHGNKDFLGMPRLMAKMGINYTTPFGLSTGLFNSYFGEGGDTSLPFTRRINPEAKPYNYMTVQLSYQLKHLLAQSKIPDMNLGLYVQNLLNEEIYYPEYTMRLVNTIPGRPGRAIHMNLTMKLNK